MTIRTAIPEDSKALIELTALTPMKGTISLRIDRKPDFFRLLQERGEYYVLVAEDENKMLVGSFSAAKQNFIINDQAQPVYYLGDLKVHPQYLKSSLAYRLVKKMYHYLLQIKANFLLCTAAVGNDSVFPFFKGRAGIPLFQTATIFNVYQMLPKRFAINEKVAADKDYKRLHSFYSSFFKRYSLYPSISHLEECLNLTIDENNTIKAALSLYDPGAIKQNVVVNFPFGIHLMLHILKGLKPFVPLPSLPKKGEALRLLYLRYFGFENADKKNFLLLLQAARDYAFQKGYHFLTIAVDEKDEAMNNLIKPVSRFNFRSHSLITSLQGNDTLIGTISKSLTYEDYSFV